MRRTVKQWEKTIISLIVYKEHCKLDRKQIWEIKEREKFIIEKIKYTKVNNKIRKM